MPPYCTTSFFESQKSGNVLVPESKLELISVCGILPATGFPADSIENGVDFFHGFPNFFVLHGSGRGQVLARSFLRIREGSGRGRFSERAPRLASVSCSRCLGRSDRIRSRLRDGRSIRGFGPGGRAGCEQKYASGNRCKGFHGIGFSNRFPILYSDRPPTQKVLTFGLTAHTLPPEPPGKPHEKSRHRRVSRQGQDH